MQRVSPPLPPPPPYQFANGYLHKVRQAEQAQGVPRGGRVKHNAPEVCILGGLEELDHLREGLEGGGRGCLHGRVEGCVLGGLEVRGRKTGGRGRG